MTDSSSPAANTLGCGGFSLLLVCGGVAVLALSSFIRGMAPYEVAVESVTTNPAAVQALGKPVKVSWFVSGRFNFKGPNNGDSELSIPVSGPNNRGTVYVEGRKEGGVWSYSKLELEIDGERIPLRSERTTKPEPESEPSS